MGTPISTDDCAEIIASMLAEKLNLELSWADLADFELPVPGLT